MRALPAAACAAAFLVVASAAQAGLTSVDGGVGVYDSGYDVTWTSDANLMQTQAKTYTGGGCGSAGSSACQTAYVSAIITDSLGVVLDKPNQLDSPTKWSGTYALSFQDFNTESGTMTWWGAEAWVTYLDRTFYGGRNTWALPATFDGYTGPSPPPSSSQMAQLFYAGLGQVAGSSITTSHNGSYSLFSNVQAGVYWSGTEDAEAEAAYNFDAGAVVGLYAPGSEFYTLKNVGFYGLAVSPGQSSVQPPPPGTPVPLPGAAWLLASGLIGLLGISRRRRAADLLTA